MLSKHTVHERWRLKEIFTVVELIGRRPFLCLMRMGRGSPVGPWSEDLERKRGLEGEAGPEPGCRPQRIDRDPALSPGPTWPLFKAQVSPAVPGITPPFPQAGGFTVKASVALRSVSGASWGQ